MTHKSKKNAHKHNILGNFYVFLFDKSKLILLDEKREKISRIAIITKEEY
jgi:hypothetical protein